jgi:ferritin heavy chain
MSNLSSVEIRQNFNKESETGLNYLINTGLDVGHILKSMAYYFDRHDVALPGFSCFFYRELKRGRFLAKRMIRYMNKRGGKFVFDEIKKPARDEWGTGIEALEFCLEVLKKVYDGVNKVVETAISSNDYHFSNFLEDDVLEGILTDIKLVGDLITELQRAGPTGLGEYQFDKDLECRFGMFSLRHHGVVHELFMRHDHHSVVGFTPEKLEVVRELVSTITKVVSIGSVEKIREIIEKMI